MYNSRVNLLGIYFYIIVILIVIGEIHRYLLRDSDQSGQVYVVYEQKFYDKLNYDSFNGTVINHIQVHYQ